MVVAALRHPAQVDGSTTARGEETRRDATPAVGCYLCVGHSVGAILCLNLAPFRDFLSKSASKKSL